MNPIDDPLNRLPQIITPILGIDESELHDGSDFRLDFNATPEDLRQIQTALENELEITLPDLSEINPFTFADLKALIEDSII